MNTPRTFPPDTKFVILETLPKTPWSVVQVIGPFDNRIEADQYAKQLRQKSMWEPHQVTPKRTLYPVNYTYQPSQPPKESPHVPPKKLP